MFHNLHTGCKHHIYIIYRPLVQLSQSGTHIYNASYHICNASCQESLILYIDCLDHTHTCLNWLYAIISNLVRQSQALSRWSGFYGFSVFRVSTCIYVSIHCIYMYLPEKLKSHRILTTWTEPDQIRDNCV